MLMSLIMGAVPRSHKGHGADASHNALAQHKVLVLRDITINVETAEVVTPAENSLVGGGWFKRHVWGMEGGGRPIPREPKVVVRFNERSQLYEITEITIYTCKAVFLPDQAALPHFGDNVTNDKSLGVREPKDSVSGKGYWRDVIRNMEGYQYADRRSVAPELQWFVPGSTKYHEEVHNRQFRAWLRQHNKSLLEKIQKGIEGRLKDVTLHSLRSSTTVDENGVEMPDGGLERVAKAGRMVVKELTPDEGMDKEKPTYWETYSAVWQPVIEQIKKQAHEAGWDKEDAESHRKAPRKPGKSQPGHSIPGPPPLR
jgi:hypothetical protein